MSERTELELAARYFYEDLSYASARVYRLRVIGASAAANHIEAELDRLLEYVASLMHEEDCDE